jgi:hypothetical protein
VSLCFTSSFASMPMEAVYGGSLLVVFMREICLGGQPLDQCQHLDPIGKVLISSTRGS